MDPIEKDIQRDLDTIMETLYNYSVRNIKINVSFLPENFNYTRKIKYEYDTIHNSRSGPRICANKVKDIIEHPFESTELSLD